MIHEKVNSEQQQAESTVIYGQTFPNLHHNGV